MGKGSGTTPAGRARARRRAILWGVGTVIVLALVMFGVSALSSPSRPTDSTDKGPVSGQPTMDVSPESRSLYERALQAQQSGDTTAALDYAQKAVDADARNAKAKSLVASLTVSASSGTGGTSASAANSQSSSSAEKAAPLSHVKDIATLLPKSVSGYSLDVPVTQAGDAVVSADPNSGTADSRRITHVLFSVHDRGTAKTARAFVETVNERVYSKNRVAISVEGRPGYFGTDGVRLASVAFWDGPYAFEVVLTTLSEDPARTRNAALTLAGAFSIPTP